MLNHYLTLFRRLVFRQQSYFLLTVSGLTIGLAALILAFVFIRDEQAYDRFQSKADRLYRVNKWNKAENGDKENTAETPGLLAPTLKADYPEVEAAAHYSPWFDPVLVTVGDKSLEIDGFSFADEQFFHLFDFELLRGDPGAVLSKPGQLVLTESLAETLFGKADPIGQTLIALSDKTYTVSGVIRNPPRQSHIQFEALASWASTEPGAGYHDFDFMNNWLGQTVYTYALLTDASKAGGLNAKLPELVAQYMPNRVGRYEFYLQPWNDIYLHSYDIRFLRGGKYGSAVFLRTFTLIALLILVIAGFNYVNISTAKSLQRAREVGVKKILGAGRRQLMGQFLSETLGTTLLAGVIALCLAYAVLPYLNRLFESEVPQQLIYNAGTLAGLSGVILLTSLFAGFFPGLLLSGFSPARVIRRISALAPGGELPRQILTTLQLGISIALISGAFILYRQFHFLMNRDLGFSKDQVMVMNTPPGIDSNHVAFKQTLEAMPGVQSVSVCQASIGTGTFGSTVLPEGSGDKEMSVQIFRVDTQFVRTYGMDMADGRFFSARFQSDFDPGALVVNETFVRQAGWDSYEGKTVRFVGSDAKVPVVGVVRDFNYNSLHFQVDPVMMYLDPRKANISVRFDPQQISALLPRFERAWRQFESRYPFEYFFVDEQFAANYGSEQRMVKVVGIFSALAIFIACLGLYGLAAFTIARRTREIGIRKVMGASAASIVTLLSRNFLVFVLIGLGLAVPATWYFLSDWLNNFAYHVPLSWGVFAVAGLAVLMVVLLTVGWQAVQAAAVNPAKTLKAE
ncbi:MAG TPA: ABC transporter permease [Flavilitoribacter sp.]|nr:ABC transporter permease [Flavilitoribacter sp.]